jgi:hypothetical protein
MSGANTVILKTTKSCSNYKGTITATVTSQDPLREENVSAKIYDEDGKLLGASAYVMYQSSVTVNNLDDGPYTVVAYGSKNPDLEIINNITIDCVPPVDITITPNLTTPNTIRLDITSLQNILSDTYTNSSGTPISVNKSILSPKHYSIVSVIDPSSTPSLNFIVTITDVTGYSENLTIYYRVRSYTKYCGANQTGSYTSTKGAFSLSSPANANANAYALAVADADVNLKCDTDIKFEEVVMEDTSFTVSYSLENKSWSCFHDYKPDAIFCTANFLMSFKETKIYIHNQYNKKGRFYNQLPTDIPAKSQIEFVAPNLLTKVYHSVSWKTQVKIEGIVNEYLTFDTVMIYNHNQCSGEVTVIPHKTTRNAEGIWRFNDFRDLMKSQDSKFLDDKGNVYPDAISSSKSFYKQARFISDYICARLTFNNKEVYTEIVLSDFSINDKVSYR